MFGWGFRAWFIIIAAVALLGWLSYIGYSLYYAGQKDVELKQAEAQITETKKVQKAYAKIDRATPHSGKSAGIKWLSGYTTASY